ncbi:EAL domain-containing protein [Clostridium sp. AM58-1XD]|uniref:EAL domain-containing protein n=1 Tax=Clostridium sp. AM58-1XD TaxID=2292307 RepID=UPI001FA917B1|nr:EAL domain-containing protein [Clostridium sp. AM58-1XD]
MPRVAEKREQIVVEHTIRMAEELGMKVICEGVENEMQVDMLGKIGCRYAQGFYYYRPMKREDFDRILRNQEILRRGKAAESL